VYRFSRSIYRELAPAIVDDRLSAGRNHQLVLGACEETVRRLAVDHRYFAKPAKTLFNDVRFYFPMSAQHRVYRVIERNLTLAQAFLASQPLRGCDLEGNPLECRATTRKGRACQRTPLPHNGYCPSHQHLAEPEDAAEIAA